MNRVHAYGLPLRFKVMTVLGALGVGLAYLLHYAAIALTVEIPWWLDTPASVGFAGLLYQLLDRRFWHVRGIIDMLQVPDFRGSWAGSLKTSHDDFAEPHEVRLEIFQTWSRMLVTLENPKTKSRSHSLGGYVVDLGDGTFELVYTFQNEPSRSGPSPLQIHKGTTVLRLSKDRQELEGDYYSGRERQTFGTLSLSRGDVTPLDQRVS